MKTPFSDSRFLVLTGNYGSGKTELALNVALHFSEQYRTTLVDLDIVNPYFRSGEKAEEMIGKFVSKQGLCDETFLTRINAIAADGSEKVVGAKKFSKLLKI